MSEQKVININPESFRVSSTRKTRKNKIPNTPLRMKDMFRTEKKQKTSTLKKNLLKLIRDNQEKQQKQKQKPETIPPHISGKGDFQFSVDSLNQLIKSTNAPSVSNSPSLTTPFLHSEIQNPGLAISAPPPYGCLKNGHLPTYRNWKSLTQRPNPSLIHRSTIKQNEYSEVPISQREKQYKMDLENKIKNLSEQTQHQLIKKQQTFVDKPKKARRQKRILRRTFRTGKSKVYPQLSVLVSNRTLRNRTNELKVELQETPIHEVRRYLSKHGFIRSGTNSPNDVLRHMYENVRLMCGEVKNHNPDNLLYNYFHESLEK